MREVQLIKEVDQEVCISSIAAAQPFVQELQNSKTGLMPQIRLSGDHNQRSDKEH
jgi:hypothetical protein